MPLHVVRLTGKPAGASFQARARDLRYDEARALAAAEGYDAVITAHNRDDQAETVLYRLAKYASPRGLVGMRPREGLLVRPLLCLGAAEIREYCRARDIQYGEDVTNAQPVYARNLVRLRVLPALADINPRVADTLAASADLAAAEADVLDEAAEAALARVRVAPPPGELAALSVRRLAAEPEALATLVLHRLVRAVLGGEALVERRAVAALLDLAARPQESGRVALRGGLEAVRGGGLLRLRRRAVAHVCDAATVTLADLTAAGRRGLTAAWCGRRYQVGMAAAEQPAAARAAAAGGHAVVAVPAAAVAVTLRHPHRGERFAPLGLGAATTVARFLAAAGVPPEARARAMVLAVDGAVAWVGYEGRDGAARGRVAQYFRVQQGTSFVVHVFEEGT